MPSWIFDVLLDLLHVGNLLLVLFVLTMLPLLLDGCVVLPDTGRVNALQREKLTLRDELRACLDREVARDHERDRRRSGGYDHDEVYRASVE